MSDLRVQWVQLTASAGILQPWWAAPDGDEALVRWLTPARDRGVTEALLWMPVGWTVQVAPGYESIIPAANWTHGPLNALEARAHFADAINGVKALGIEPSIYEGCWARTKAYDDTPNRRRSRATLVRLNTVEYRGLPVVYDAMARGPAEWWPRLDEIAAYTRRVVGAEGFTEPPDRFAWFLMHRDWKDANLTAWPLARLAEAAKRHPAVYMLIRSDADLNGADRATRIAELMDAGIRAVADYRSAG